VTPTTAKPIGNAHLLPAIAHSKKIAGKGAPPLGNPGEGKRGKDKENHF
jgi:hypothetical protein